MKTLITIIAFFRFFVQTSDSNVINFSLPENTVRLSSQQFTQYSKNKLKVNTLNNDARVHYQNGDITLTFWDATRPLYTEKTLESRQGVSDRLLKRTKPDAVVKRSEIVKFNNIRHLIFQYEVNGIGKLLFNSEYFNNQNFRGELIYKLTDRDKANELLTQILQSSKRR